MSHYYRCETCSLSSAPGSRSAAETTRDAHREAVHGGLVPDGDGIQRAPREPFRWRKFAGFWLGLAAWAIADLLWRHL